MQERQRVEVHADAPAGDLLTPRALVARADDPPEAIALTGILTNGARSGYHRLYLDVTLKDYVEISDEDVRHLEWVGSEQSIFGRKATLWIRRGAALDYTTTRG